MNKTTPGRSPEKRRRLLRKSRRGVASKSGPLNPKINLSDVTAGGVHVTKQEKVLGLLRRAKGASLETLMTETGWQKHTLRGFMASTVRRKLRLAVISEKINGIRTYRIAPPKRSVQQCTKTGKPRKAD